MGKENYGSGNFPGSLKNSTVSQLHPGQYLGKQQLNNLFFKGMG